MKSPREKNDIEDFVINGKLTIKELYELENKQDSCQG